MILRPCLAAVTALLVFAVAGPTEAFAASSTQKKIKSTLKQLKKLPNAASPSSKVTQLVKKLTKLDPKKAAKYYKTGLPKLAPEGAQQAAIKMANEVNKIVERAGLPAKQVDKIVKQVEKEETKYTPPAPTPTPYVASVRLPLAGACA